MNMPRTVKTTTAEEIAVLRIKLDNLVQESREIRIFPRTEESMECLTAVVKKIHTACQELIFAIGCSDLAEETKINLFKEAQDISDNNFDVVRNTPSLQNNRKQPEIG